MPPRIEQYVTQGGGRRGGRRAWTAEPAEPADGWRQSPLYTSCLLTQQPSLPRPEKLQTEEKLCNPLAMIRPDHIRRHPAGWSPHSRMPVDQARLSGRVKARLQGLEGLSNETEIIGRALLKHQKPLACNDQKKQCRSPNGPTGRKGVGSCCYAGVANTRLSIRNYETGLSFAGSVGE